MEKKTEKDEMPIGIDEFLEISDGDYPIEVSEELVYFIKSRCGLEKEIIEIVLKQFFLAIRYFSIKLGKVYVPQFGVFTTSETKFKLTTKRSIGLKKLKNKFLKKKNNV